MGLPGSKNDLAIIIARGSSGSKKMPEGYMREKAPMADGDDDYKEAKYEGMTMAADKMISAVKEGDASMFSKALEQWCNIYKMGNTHNYESNDEEY